MKMNKQKSSENIEVLHVEDTIYTADSVEWCPNAPCQNVFVCATYQLAMESDEEKNKRFGKIRLYSLDKNNDLKLHQTINNEAVLDQKWCNNKINNQSYLGVVSAKNTLEIYKLDTELLELHFVTSISNENEEVLMLSLDWDTGKYISETPSIVTSDSKGNISLFQFKNEKLTLKSTWNAHMYEAWICAFYYWNSAIIFTGGDDANLFKFDLRENTKPVFKCKEYGAGVTSIHSNKEKEYILATGSYDTNMHLWDMRNMKSYLSTLTMPDSVWRLKWNPNDYNILLAACMRQGFHIVNATVLEQPNIVANYYEHEDIAYGCDWKYIEDENEIESYSKSYIIAACSFYDHKMSVAKVDLSNC